MKFDHFDAIETYSLWKISTLFEEQTFWQCEVTLREVRRGNTVTEATKL